MSESNGTNKNMIAIILAVITIMGSVGGIVTQYVGHSEDKAAIYRKLHQKQIDSNEHKIEKILRILEHHILDPNLHSTALVRIEERLKALEKTINDVQKEQKARRTNRVYNKKE